MHSGFDQFLVFVVPSFMINEHVTLLEILLLIGDIASVFLQPLQVVTKKLATKKLAMIIILITYFGVKVDGHRTMLGFGISAISEHSTV